MTHQMQARKFKDNGKNGLSLSAASRELGVTVRIHASRPAANRALEELMVKLNEAEIKYPGTDLQVVYKIRGDGRGQKNPEGVS